MWFMCLKKSPAALSGSAPCERGHGGGLPRRQLPRASRVAARRLLSASLPVAVPQPSRGLGRFGYTKCATTGPNTKAPLPTKKNIIGTHLKPIARTHNSNNPARRRYVITHTHATQPSVIRGLRHPREQVHDKSTLRKST